MLPPDCTERLPPSCGEVSPEISLNSVDIIIWLEFDISSTVMPRPAVSCLNCTPSVVGLTANIAPSCPKNDCGVSSRAINVSLSPSPNELYSSLKLSFVLRNESLILSPVPSFPILPISTILRAIYNPNKSFIYIYLANNFISLM